MEKLINSFATKNASWLSGISIFLGLAIGIFTTSMMQTEFTFLTVSIFLLCVVIELGISIMNLSHGMFELTGNKYAERRSWVAIVLGFIFNSALIYGAAAANVFTYSQAFLFWLIYMGANIFRIFFGFMASTMIHTTKEALQTTIAYKNQQVELSKISAIAEVEMAKQFQIVRKLELEAAKELNENQPKKLAAHEKFAATTGAVIGKIAGAKSVMGNAFSENFSAAKQRKPENLAENVRKPTENVENLNEKKSPYPITEIKAIFFKEDESISVMFEDESLVCKMTNLKSLKSNLDMRKNKNHEKYNADYALFLQFVLENIPEKTETGSATRIINAQIINEFLFRQESDDNSTTA
jgi:hypothetical protein